MPTLQIEYNVTPASTPQSSYMSTPQSQHALTRLVPTPQLDPTAVYLVSFRHRTRRLVGVAYAVTPDSVWLFWAEKDAERGFHGWSKRNKALIGAWYDEEEGDTCLLRAVLFVPPDTLDLEDLQKCHMDENALLLGDNMRCECEYAGYLLKHVLWTRGHAFDLVDKLKAEMHGLPVWRWLNDEREGAEKVRRSEWAIPDDHALRVTGDQVVKYQTH